MNGAAVLRTRLARMHLSRMPLSLGTCWDGQIRFTTVSSKPVGTSRRENQVRVGGPPMMSR